MKAEEFRAALDGSLELAASDERIEPLLRAAGLRMRFAFPDCDLRLSVSTSSTGEDSLSWSFEDVDWPPKLELEMDSTVANRFFRGRASLAVAIARGQAQFRGEGRTALLYLPATRLLFGPYESVVRSGFPELAAA
jgi:hypothetical protein